MYIERLSQKTTPPLPTRAAWWRPKTWNRNLQLTGLRRAANFKRDRETAQPDALNGGGMPDAAVEVIWEIADSESFGTVLRKGVELAAPELGHLVHAEISGLQPDALYRHHYPWRQTHASSLAGELLVVK
jgi:hypothetical protein